jgi:hypothetical protein
MGLENLREWASDFPAGGRELRAVGPFPGLFGAKVSTWCLDKHVDKPVDKRRFGEKSMTLVFAQVLTTFRW